jgi:excisionase family DNA binding protein
MAPILTSPRLAYSVLDAAELTGLSVRSMRYLMRQGRLGYVRLGRRVRIRHADLEALLRKHTVKALPNLDAETPIRPAQQE